MLHNNQFKVPVFNSQSHKLDLFDAKFEAFWKPAVFARGIPFVSHTHIQPHIATLMRKIINDAGSHISRNIFHAIWQNFHLTT